MRVLIRENNIDVNSELYKEWVKLTENDEKIQGYLNKNDLGMYYDMKGTDFATILEIASSFVIKEEGIIEAIKLAWAIGFRTGCRATKNGRIKTKL